MARGELLTLGTCDFIKKEFGVGYHLNVFAKNKNFNDLELKKSLLNSVNRRSTIESEHYLAEDKI